MASRIATLTLRVKYDTDTVLNPAHLIGGTIDEILSWNAETDNKRLGIRFECSDAEYEDAAQAARREALMLTGLYLDAAAAGDCTSLTDLVFEAVKTWCAEEGLDDTFKAFLTLQREAMAAGFGQTK
jgi:hypothetical protein